MSNDSGYGYSKNGGGYGHTSDSGSYTGYGYGSNPYSDWEHQNDQKQGNS